MGWWLNNALHGFAKKVESVAGRMTPSEGIYEQGHLMEKDEVTIGEEEFISHKILWSDYLKDEKDRDEVEKICAKLN